MAISSTGTLCCPRKLPNSFPRPTSCPRQSGEVSACNKAKDGFTTWFTNQNLIFYYSGVQWRRRINAPAKTRQCPCSLLSSLLSFWIRWYWLIHWHSPSRHSPSERILWLKTTATMAWVACGQSQDFPRIYWPQGPLPVTLSLLRSQFISPIFLLSLRSYECAKGNVYGFFFVSWGRE